MKLTRKKAIELCIEAWTIHAETGCRKSELPEKHRGMCNECWFCEYDERQKKLHGGDNCKHCPLVNLLGIKYCSDSYFGRWAKARFPSTRKKYAKLFLNQIKSIKQGT